MVKNKLIIVLFLSLICSITSKAQTVSNLIAGFNVEKGVIEISYDLSGEAYQGFSIDLKLKQIAENTIIEVPVANISPALDLVYPGAKKKIEVSLDNLNLDGEFIPILTPTAIASQKPAPVETKQVEKVVREKVVQEKEPVVEEEVVEKPKENKSPSFVRGFTIIGKSFQDLSNQLRVKSEVYMVDGNYHPVNIKINLDTFTFSCDFVESDTGFIKLGLYFGPKSTGCESCFNVIQKNPNSRVLREINHKNFIFSLIAIHK